MVFWVSAMDADDLDLLADLELALLDAPRDDRAATRDREHVLDRHEERLVDVADRLGNVRVDRSHELEDLRSPLGVALERLQRGHLDDGDVVARELVLGEELAHLHLDELEQLGIVDHVGLVQRDDDRGDLDLTGEQDVLARLRHRAVGRGDDEDGTVHLGGTRDHVLDVVGVTRAVDVRVVPVLGLVLDVRRVDRDPALALFRCLVDLVEGRRLRVRPGLGENLRDRGCERRLAVVDVADRADVDVRLGALELLLGHLLLSSELVFHDYGVFSPPTIDSAIVAGTSSYRSNCMLNVARPWLIERRSVA